MTHAEAAARYRVAWAAYDAAAAASMDARNVGGRMTAARARRWQLANQAALTARDRMERARDDLVAAALAHDCEAA